MRDSKQRAVAIVGLGAILPDALSADAFWQNIIHKRYSITEVPPERWNPADYYHPDHDAPDKTYSKIGGWVRGFEFDWKKYKIPPKVAAAMDQGQQWAVTVADMALSDYGYPNRPLDTERTAVILGTAMGGELHYLTSLRIFFPEFAHALESVDEFEKLPAGVRRAILEKWHEVMVEAIPPITEDTMPGELPNITSGRVANILNLRGPSFITDAACAASFAAVSAAIEMLTEHQVDAVITGGVDRNMGVSTFVKFCKIGALSATGSRPFADGADGFVMGEGAGAFLLKRLEDAERDGDKIYAVIRGVGGASDGKGKGITAPNPIGQQHAIRRAWENADLDPATASLIEAHGTSTPVGDVVEIESLNAIFGTCPKAHSMALGSVKSNIGHLKAGAGAAGLLKTTLALHHKILPPTLNAEQPNPNINFGHTPFYLNTETREWGKANGTPRRAGVSAYGFGGTNFHLVMEEYVPGALTEKSKTYTGVSIPERGKGTSEMPAPVRGMIALGADTPQALKNELDSVAAQVEGGWTPGIQAPELETLRAPERLFIDFGSREELLSRLHTAQKGMGFDTDSAWKAFQAQGIFRGSGAKKGKLAYLFPGQGSQYLNMGRALAKVSPIVREVLADADAVMTPILGKPLLDYIFVDDENDFGAQMELLQTAITQPAMLALDIAIYRLLEHYGFKPDVVMGHSLGEYAALIVSGIMPFADALEAAAARGSEMTKVSMGDNGKMAAVLAPINEVNAVLSEITGYVVPANLNSHAQCVIGGESRAVEQAVEIFTQKGYKAVEIPVSHAFHTRIVAPAGEALRKVLDRLQIASPQMPLVSNVTGEFYPTEVSAIKDLLQQQVASPVQWVKGMETLYQAGVRGFVECGPKRALKSFVDDVLGKQPDLTSLLTNHPKTGELASFNQALCGLYAAGFYPLEETRPVSIPAVTASAPMGEGVVTPEMLNQALAGLLQQINQQTVPQQSNDRNLTPLGSVVISGTGLGLPGAEKSLMDEDNVMRILRGEQFIDLIPERFRKRMLAKRVTRVRKASDGGGSFETITDAGEVIKLAGRPGYFDLEAEYGIPGKLIEALDSTTQLAIGAGIDALREAGIPLVQTYKRTTTGSVLPDRWMLPEALRDETGVIFASAFPGMGRFADEMERYFTYYHRLESLELLESLREQVHEANALREINRRAAELREALEREPYTFDRRFIFRVLAMGHSQFAEYIGARGPNTHINGACASTTQAVSMAEDWIRAGRCRRVLVIAADNVTSDSLMEWVGAGFLAAGAAATDDRVEEAALPFDRRRHGTILGMGACALVVESEDCLRERGMRGIVEVLAGEYRNSAYHGTRLDVEHIAGVMNDLMTAAERRFGLHRAVIASQMLFMSHETYTPARGGSASAEVVALRRTFGDAASDIVIANTKGFTGHPMGVGVEDVIAVKALEYGIVPPVPNYKEVDPDLGVLNLSRGGHYPVQFALHFAAGFGSQLGITLIRRIPGALDRIDNKPLYQQWLDALSGGDRAEVEVVKRTLRIKANGAPVRSPAPSRWQLGTGPTLRALVAGDQPTAPVSASINATFTAPTAPPRLVYESSAPEPVMVSAPPPPAVPEPVRAAPEPLQRVDQDIDPIADQVLALVAAQTGYPVDMLQPDLDLEADLGVDTVKQAETFSAIREAFNIPREESLKLRDYRTLAQVVGYVKAHRPDLVKAVPAPAVMATPLAAPVVTSPAASDGEDTISARVLEIVAAQTGYPVDMLQPDLDLEADLGVDTVKQAETFSAIREAFDIPREESLKLRDYPTLAQVVGYVKSHRPDLVKAVPAPAVMATPLAAPVVTSPAASGGEDPISARVLEIVAAQTGYPVDMLQPDLDLEADLGVDTVKQAETFSAIREAFDIPREESLKLRDYPTLAQVVGYVKAHRPDLVKAVPAPAVMATPLAAPVVTSPAASGGEDAISARVLEIVAAQTGYPVDMLQPDLDLEADLGVDTVKQAETFSAIREAFDIPREESLKLRDYPTLSHVIGFVKAHRPDLAGASGGIETAAPAVVQPSASAPTLQAASLEAADLMPRRVAVPTLRPASRFCKPTGVNLNKKDRVLIMPDASGVAEALANALAERGVITLTADPHVDAETFSAQITEALSEGAIKGVYWLPALEIEPEIESLDLNQWRELLRVRVKNLYTAMRTLYETITTPENFLVVGTRLGGMHGYGAAGASAPLGGAVTGFAKAYKRERLEALVKAVDFAPHAPAEAVAAELLEETLSDPGVVEIGYGQGGRYAVTLIETPAVDGSEGLPLNGETVFLVTGAAGGITSAIVSDLAAASGGIFFLTDLVSLPEPDDESIRLFRQDREALKKHLIDLARSKGERPTPAQIDKAVFAIEREEAALRAVEAVEAAGGTAFYRSANLLDPDALNGVVDEIRERFGRIDVLIHAGGMEISRTLPDKDPKQFDLVFDIKADGFFSLLKAAAGMPIGATVVFSSVAGRFGNSGQTDYSAANDLLCKISSSLRRWRPHTRGIAVDWTAWGGIGMATRGSIPKIMEMAGIDMLPPESGIPTVRRELVSSAFRGEIVVGGKLGILVKEFEEDSGGVEGASLEACAREHHLALVGAVKGCKLYGGLEVETTLDPKTQAFLYDHAMEGTPLLPGVMATEAFAQMAKLSAPEYTVTGVEKVKLMQPFKFYRGEPATLYLRAVTIPAADGDLISRCELRSFRPPNKPGLPAQEKLHFRAEVHLSRGAVAPPVMEINLPDMSALTIGAEKVYAVYFHGPAYRVLERVGVGADYAIGLMAQELPPDAPDPVWLMYPRLIELAFQTAGIWEIKTNSTLALPASYESVSTYGGVPNGSRLYALVEAVDGGQSFNALVTDERGKVYVRLDGYRTSALPDKVTL